MCHKCDSSLLNGKKKSKYTNCTTRYLILFVKRFSCQNYVVPLAFTRMLDR